MNGFEKRAQEKKKEILQAAFDLMNTDIGTADGIHSVTCSFR